MYGNENRNGKATLLAILLGALLLIPIGMSVRSTLSNTVRQQVTVTESEFRFGGQRASSYWEVRTSTGEKLWKANILGENGLKPGTYVIEVSREPSEFNQGLRVIVSAEPVR